MNITVSNFLRNISLTQCINIIVQNYTSQYDLISVYSDNGDFYFPHKQMDYAKMVVSKFNPIKPQLYLIDNLEQTKLRRFIKGLRNREIAFNARAKYIFIRDEFDDNFLRPTAKSYLLNALFLNSYSGEVSSYFPFKYNSLNKMSTNLVPFGICREGDIQLFDNYTDLFPKKLPNKWENSTLRVMHHHHKVYSMCGDCDFQGIEIEMFDTISRLIGVKAVFYRVDHPRMAWKLFAEGVFDLFLTNYIPIAFTDFTMSYIREIYLWFVPFPGITPRWKNILTVFPTDVWISWIPSAILISCVWTVTSVISGKNGFIQLLRIIGFIGSLFLEQGRKVHSPKWIHEVLLLASLFLAFFMNTFFKSRLTYLLNGLNYVKPIASFEEAIERNMFIGALPEYEVMFNTSNAIAKYLEKKLVICDFDSLYCANRVAFDRDMVSMQSATKIIDAKSHFFDDKSGHWLITPIFPRLAVKPISASFQLGFPMFTLYNKYLYRLVECGIVDKISRKYYDEKELTTTIPSTASTNSLNLDHVVAPGVIWLVGVILSIMLFTLERYELLNFIYHKKKKVLKDQGNSSIIV